MPGVINQDVMKFEELRGFYQKFLIDSNVNSLNLELKQPNIFNILKIEGAEIRHSNFLAWLLNPQESHGLGETIFRRLIIELFFHEKSNKINDHLIHDIDYTKVEIFREWYNIDILIICPLLKNEKSNLIICIENKVKSKDFEGQLDKYFKKVNDNFPPNRNEIIFVYLTLYGDEPTKKVDNLSFIFCSYIKIKDIIEDTLKIYDSNISIKIKSYIEDYLSSIKRNFMEQDKTIDYAKRIYKEHKELIDFVLEKGIENKFQPASKDFCQKKGHFLIDSKINSIMFLPQEWKNIFDSKPITGSNTIQHPIAFLLKKKNNSLGLSLIIYPFKDQSKRKLFLSKIKSYEDFKDFKISTIDRGLDENIESQYTTLKSESERKIESWDDSLKIEQTCEKLYNQFIKNNLIETFKKFLEVNEL